MLADASSDRVLVIKDVYFASTSTCTCACKLYSKPLADNAGRKKRQNLGLFWVFSLHVLPKDVPRVLDSAQHHKGRA